MNWNIPFTTDRTERAPTIAAFLALAAVLGIAGVAVFGGAATAEEVANTTVEVDNSTSEIYVTATFNDTITDANATADVVITDPNGTEFVNTTIDGTAGNVTTGEYNVSDVDPDGNYSVVVSAASSGVVDSVDVGTFMEGSSGGGGATTDDSSGWGTLMGYPIWIVVIVVIAVALVGQTREWWDLTEVGG